MKSNESKVIGGQILSYEKLYIYPTFIQSLSN